MPTTQAHHHHHGSLPFAVTHFRADLRSTLHRLFGSVPVQHHNATTYALFPLTDFHPAMLPSDMSYICEGIHALLHSFADSLAASASSPSESTAAAPLSPDAVGSKRSRSSDAASPGIGAANGIGIDAFIGVASRSGGPLVHGVSLLENGLPYSLANWYPAGSKGDIIVDHHGGFSGEGVTFLNGLKPGMRVILVDDCLRSGHTAGAMVRAVEAAGVTVVASIFAAEITNCNGRRLLTETFPHMKLFSLVRVNCATTTSVIENDSTDDITVAPPSSVLRCRTVETILSYDAATIKTKFLRSLEAFVGIPIYRATGSDYPYSNFTLTDFIPMLRPLLVEDMADCLVYLMDQALVARFSAAASASSSATPPSQSVIERSRQVRDAIDIVVSEADRGGGPLVYAVAARLGKPFTLANWYSGHTDVGVATQAYVGYSGSGKIFLNGLKSGDRCFVVDDMLSSGGTCEALFRGIDSAGCKIVAGGFASEKVNTGGRGRLLKQWPDSLLLSICYFISEGDKTKLHPPTREPQGNPTPVQPHA